MKRLETRLDPQKRWKPLRNRTGRICLSGKYFPLFLKHFLKPHFSSELFSRNLLPRRTGYLSRAVVLGLKIPKLPFGTERSPYLINSYLFDIKLPFLVTLPKTYHRGERVGLGRGVIGFEGFHSFGRFAPLLDPLQTLFRHHRLKSAPFDKGLPFLVRFAIFFIKWFTRS